MASDCKTKLLLVEDDKLLCTLTGMLLEDFGYAVVTAANGEEAVRLATLDTDIDLVLMDIDLGQGMDGTEAAQRILAGRSLPIVFLTAHAEEALVRKVRGITRYGYVIKNSGDFVLQSSIEMALDLFSAHQKNEAALRSFRESEEIFSQFLEHSPIYIFFKDENIRAIKLSRNYETMLGRPLDDILGRNMDDLFPSDLAKSMVEDDKRILRNGCEVVVDEDLGGRRYTTIKFPITLSGQPRYLAGFTIDITEQTRALHEVSEARDHIAKLLAEKELLLREIHHRVKNNMNTITSLLALQVRRIGDGVAAAPLIDAQNRINSMRVIYDNLFLTEDFRTIPVRKYLEDLVSAISSACEIAPGITTRIETEDIVLDSRILFPVGMMVNELLTNAYKYAFQDRTEGQITLTIRLLPEDTMQVVCADDGIGLPPGILDGERAGFGLNLIAMLVQQLGGTFRWETVRGTTFHCAFPVRDTGGSVGKAD